MSEPPDLPESWKQACGEIGEEMWNESPIGMAFVDGFSGQMSRFVERLYAKLTPPDLQQRVTALDGEKAEAWKAYRDRTEQEQSMEANAKAGWAKVAELEAANAALRPALETLVAQWQQRAGCNSEEPWKKVRLAQLQCVEELSAALASPARTVEQDVSHDYTPEDIVELRAEFAEWLKARNVPDDVRRMVLPWLPAHTEPLGLGPIDLNEGQLRAVKEWADDDRLWTTQEIVEHNLLTFARLMMKAALASPARTEYSAEATD